MQILTQRLHTVYSVLSNEASFYVMDYGESYDKK